MMATVLFDSCSVVGSYFNTWRRTWALKNNFQKLYHLYFLIFLMAFLTQATPIVFDKQRIWLLLLEAFRVMSRATILVIKRLVAGAPEKKSERSWGCLGGTQFWL
jgi:hypothetical protein